MPVTQGLSELVPLYKLMEKRDMEELENQMKVRGQGSGVAGSGVLSCWGNRFRTKPEPGSTFWTLEQPYCSGAIYDVSVAML